MHCCADMVLSFFERERERETEKSRNIYVYVFFVRGKDRERAGAGAFFSRIRFYLRRSGQNRGNTPVCRAGGGGGGGGGFARESRNYVRLAIFGITKFSYIEFLHAPPPQTTGALLLLARGRSHVCMRDSKMKMWHGFSPRSKKTSFRRLVDCCFVSAIAPACSSQHSMPRTVGGPGRARSMAFSAAARAVIDIIICEGRGGHCPLSTKQTSGGSSSSVM